jgi:hypothetical protein
MFAGSHNMIKVWDIETLQCVKTITTGNKGGKSIYTLAVAGDYLLAGTYENSIHVRACCHICNLLGVEFEKL